MNRVICTKIHHFTRVDHAVVQESIFDRKHRMHGQNSNRVASRHVFRCVRRNCDFRQVAATVRSLRYTALAMEPLRSSFPAMRSGTRSGTILLLNCLYYYCIFVVSIDVFKKQNSTGTYQFLIIFYFYFLNFL